jgi:hypothetical protein
LQYPLLTHSQSRLASVLRAPSQTRRPVHPLPAPSPREQPRVTETLSRHGTARLIGTSSTIRVCVSSLVAVIRAYLARPVLLYSLRRGRRQDSPALCLLTDPRPALATNFLGTHRRTLSAVTAVKPFANPDVSCTASRLLSIAQEDRPGTIATLVSVSCLTRHWLPTSPSTPQQLRSRFITRRVRTINTSVA